MYPAIGLIFLKSCGNIFAPVADLVAFRVDCRQLLRLPCIFKFREFCNSVPSDLYNFCQQIPYKPCL